MSVTQITSFSQPLAQLSTLLVARQQEITTHPAWRILNETESETILTGCPLGTYLLRPGERETIYYLSWVVWVDNAYYVRHQQFSLYTENNQISWLYKNGKPNFEELLKNIIPKMMHLPPDQCSPLVLLD